MQTELEDTVQSILRCQICHKPFDKPSTLKRHGYYCRSRKAGKTSRSRSCLACARAKARCDGGRPHCSRCVLKHHGCEYRAESPGLKNSRSAIDQQPAFDVSSNSSASLPLPNIESDMLFLEDGPHLAGVYSSSWTPPDAFFGQPYWSANNSIPATPTLFTRSFLRRTPAGPGSQKAADLMLHNLKSYLLGMLRHGTLPPFVHVGLQAGHVPTDGLESITNCISLIHMISSRRGSRKLFWKNVRMECERVCAERQVSNRNELVAAMQALFIYILMRIDEGETEHNNIDVLLTSTVAAIGQQLYILDAVLKAERTAEEIVKPTWHGWVLEESRRRLRVVYRVLDMLVYFDPMSQCSLPSGLLLAPLPAQRQLWEASEEVLWQMQSRALEGSDPAFGLATTGELVKLSESSLLLDHTTLTSEHEVLGLEGTTRAPATWDEWLTDVDGFGGLVMLAASFAQ